MQLPNGWFNSKLINLCEVFTDGDWIESKDQSTGGIRLVQTGNIGLGEFKNRRDKARWISLETFEKLKCQEIFEGDCLISRLPDPVGRSCIIPNTGDRMITAVDCTILRFKRSLLIPEYFNYYSQSYTYQQEIKQNCSGATRERISRKNLGLTNIVYPEIKEQKRIVAILDEAFADINQAIANTEKNLANARELFESYLNKSLNDNLTAYKNVKLSDVCSIESTLIDPKKQEFQQLLHIGAGNIIADTGELFDLKTALQEKLISGKFLFNKNMVLYSKIRPYLRKVCRPNFSGLCSADIYPLMPYNSLSKNYLFYLLFSKNFTDYAVSGSDRAGMPKVNRIHLFNYSFNIPPKEKQEEISSNLDNIRDETQKIQETYQQKLQSLGELKQSLLQKAFSGELTANNVDKLVNP